MDILEPKKIVYTAQSRHLFYARMLITKYTIEQDVVPLNPFNVWGYFLYEMTDRDLVRRGNNNIVRISDEVWVFGPIADGVLAEIDLAMHYDKPLRFFSAGSKLSAIQPISLDDLVFEPDAEKVRSADKIKAEIQHYLSVNEHSLRR